MFGIESKFYQATTVIYKVVFANLLFLITCLPIVTIPASISALLYTLSGEETSVMRRYFKHFKDYFFKTIPLGFVNIFSFFTMLSILYGLQTKSLVMQLLLGIVCLFLLAYNINIYLFQNETNQKNYFWLFRNAFIWTIMTFHRVFLIILVLGITCYIIDLFLSNTVIFFGIGTLCYVFQSVFITSMKQYKGIIPH